MASYIRTAGQQEVSVWKGLNRLVNICLGCSYNKVISFPCLRFLFVLDFVFASFMFFQFWQWILYQSPGEAEQTSAFTISRSRRSWQWKGSLVPELLHSFRSFSSYEYKSLEIPFTRGFPSLGRCLLNKPPLLICLYSSCYLTMSVNQWMKSVHTYVKLKAGPQILQFTLGSTLLQKHRLTQNVSVG